MIKLLDLLKEIKAVRYVEPNFEFEWGEANRPRYPEFQEMGKDKWIKLAKKGYTTKYSKIKDVLGNIDLDFDNLIKPKKGRFEKAFASGTIELPIVIKFSDNDYDLLSGNTRVAGLNKNGIDPQLWVIDMSKLKGHGKQSKKGI